jgi:hypothetical protein
VAWDDERADAAEQLLVAIDEPVVELRPVEELVGDLGVRECLLVVLPLDDDFGVGEEEVAAAVIGMQMGVDDVGDVRWPRPDASWARKPRDMPAPCSRRADRRSAPAAGNPRARRVGSFASSAKELE